MSRERILGAIEALEKISANPGFPTLAANLVELWITWTHEVIAALPPEPEQRDSAREILADIIRDLPNRRDWLDPVTERRAKELLASPEPEPWTARERRLRERLEDAADESETILEHYRPQGWHQNDLSAARALLPQLRAAIADTPPPDPASVESTLAAVARDDAERTIERMHGPAKPDPRDEALELMELALVEYLERRYLSLDSANELLAAIRAARGTK